LAMNTRPTSTPKLPTVQVGKQGMTENTIAEIKKQLQKHKQVRVKLLKNSTATKEEALQLAEKVKGKVVKKIGKVVVLKK
jgi:RNA-binding protein